MGTILGYIHLPEIKISEHSLFIGSGEITNLPIREWIRMDRAYERFGTQINRNGGQLTFYKINLEDKKGLSIDNQIEVAAKRIHLSIILYTGIPTVMPELSTRYILYKNDGKTDAITGDSLKRIIGDAGREYIVNNHTKVEINKGEEVHLNFIYKYLNKKEHMFNLNAISYFTDSIFASGIIAMKPELKITHLVSTMENLLIPLEKTKIRSKFVDCLLAILGKSYLTNANDELHRRIDTIYRIRNAVVHGQETKKILKKITINIDELYSFFFNVYLFVFLKLFNNWSPELNNLEQAISLMKNSKATLEEDLIVRWLKP